MIRLDHRHKDAPIVKVLRQPISPETNGVRLCTSALVINQSRANEDDDFR